MKQSRENDKGKAPEPERIERTFNVDDRWYFELRGGGQRGPFDSKEEMEQALAEFIALQQEVKSHLQS